VQDGDQVRDRPQHGVPEDCGALPERAPPLQARQVREDRIVGKTISSEIFPLLSQNGRSAHDLHCASTRSAASPSIPAPWAAVWWIKTVLLHRTRGLIAHASEPSPRSQAEFANHSGVRRYVRAIRSPRRPPAALVCRRRSGGVRHNSSAARPTPFESRPAHPGRAQTQAINNEPRISHQQREIRFGKSRQVSRIKIQGKDARRDARFDR
jgi:hypothetical protein